MEIGSIFDINMENLFNYKRDETFEFEFDIEKEYKNKKFFNTGRSAISYLLKYCLNSEEDIEILIPTFLCSSILKSVKDSGISYKFYKINKDFTINIESVNKQITTKTKIFFFIDYVGFFHDEQTCKFIKSLSDKGIVVVEDMTQSLFSVNKGKIGIGDYIIASIRKWGAFPDGAILASKENNPILEYRIDNGCNEYAFNYFVAQVMKNSYLKKMNLDKNMYLDYISIANDSLFSDYEIRKITDISTKLISNLNTTELIDKRKINARYLYENLKDMKEIYIPLDYRKDIVPFGFVILSDYRDLLIKHFIKNNIYCNIHWNVPKESLDKDNELMEISDKILTIPCDQRYGKEECDYIIKVLKNFFRNGDK